MTPVPIHTVAPATTPSTPPSHAGHATPQPPGAPHAEPGTSPQQHPHQDSLNNIRNDLHHYPGGLTEPHPHDQQALVNAVPHEPDGTPQRFPDPFGHWSQLQNDGGNQVPGRSNNCADCSRSFLETWYGNPQVSAPRTLDVDQHGNLDPWSPEHNANANQIRWTGAAHTYAGTGSDPETPHRIASDLQQAGHGAAAIVQVDWPGGGGHAFNAVNHHGDIIWIDTQSGEVSHQPLHIPNAEHVWHIPLDANRNPIHPTTPPDSSTSHHETETPEEGTGTSHKDPDNSPEETENHKAPEPNSSETPSKKTPDEHTPNPEARTTPHNPPFTGSDNHNGESPSHAEPQPPHADTPKNEGSSTRHPSDATAEPDSRSPHTAGESRNGNEGDRVTPPARDNALTSHNSTQTDSTHTHDPHTADPAPSSTNRSGNNDTHPVTDRVSTNAPDAPPSDPRSNRSNPDQAPTPDTHTPRTDRHTAAGHSLASPADTNHRGPEEPAGPKSENGKKPDDLTDTSDKKQDPDDRPYTDPHDRGTSDTSEQSRSVTHDGPDSDASRTLESESETSKEYGLLPDELQGNLRADQSVHRVELDRVHHRLDQWADSGALAHVLQVTSGDREHPDTPGDSRSFTRSQLSRHLPGFEALSRGEQQAVVASLARLDLSYHHQHSVGRSPEAVAHAYRASGEGDPEPGTTDSGAKKSKESLGVRLHRKFANNFLKETLKGLPEDATKALKKHGPDFTDKNFAVLEVEGPPPDREVHYVVDSSVPANIPKVTPRHSEKHLLEWLKRVDPDGSHYKPLGLYTEREPCGEGKGHAKCSQILGDERLAGIPIHYSATYREDPQAVQERSAMISARDEAVSAVDGLTDHEVKAELERRLRDRLVPHSKILPGSLERLTKMSTEEARGELRKSITNEHNRLRDAARSHKEQAITAEMTRHIDALQRTWEKLHSQPH
ncbi:toxin glutamine deamidase domain-containing protein [Streptomyces sp. NPDC002513]